MDRGMQYRPEYRLDRLRMMLDSNCQRWLRTMVVDLSHTAERDVDERLAQQLWSAVGCAVERVVCKDLSEEHLAQLRSFVTQCVPLLTSLDLRGCAAGHVDDFLLAVAFPFFGFKHVDGAFLLVVADAHGKRLRRLYLPEYSSIAQSTLDHFTQLEELHAGGCQYLTNVNFCSATLRVLYANGCHNLTDAGLRRATRLEVLHVRGCRQVTDVSPFAHCLLELDASFWCGIGSGVLSDCHRLQVLNADYNGKITTLQPFAQLLRELKAGDRCALNGAALADVTGLVSLSAECNRAITTVAPFGASLRRLDARHSMIGDAGLVTATNLVSLNASDNSRIRSLAPFCASLSELRACGRCLSEGALSAVTNLIWLDVSDNERITTVQWCGRSLRHLVAGGEDCALTNEGLSTATQLVTLDCSGNPNLTTMEPFLHSLEELEADSDAQCREVGRAPYLHYIAGRAGIGYVALPSGSVAQLERNGFFIRRNLPGVAHGSTAIMHRNTVTYVFNSTDKSFRMCTLYSRAATENVGKKRANQCCFVM